MMLDNSYFFFFNDPATTETYPLSLHAALPIYGMEEGWESQSARDLNATSCPPQPPALDYPTPCVAAKPYPGKKPYTNPLNPDQNVDYDGDNLPAGWEFQAWKQHKDRTQLTSLWYSDGKQASQDSNAADGCSGLTQDPVTGQVDKYPTDQRTRA